MSGLDGLGWPNPKDEPKPKKTMNSQLEIKLAPTPETDALIRTQLARVGMTPTALASKLTLKCEELERDRDKWREKADTMFAKHAEILDQARRERDEAQRRLRKAQVENDHNWQAMELYEAERVLADKLADIADGTGCRECGGEDQARLARDALAAWKEARK